jgi:hypothetical protein
MAADTTHRGLLVALPSSAYNFCPFSLLADIVDGVRRPSQAGKNLLRPMVDEDCADGEIIKMMTKCWSEDPLDRPDFSALKVAIRKLNK